MVLSVIISWIRPSISSLILFCDLEMSIRSVFELANMLLNIPRCSMAPVFSVESEMLLSMSLITFSRSEAITAGVIACLARSS
ncbi:hypothetical protein D3C73_1488530 [compost metagenome]